MARRSHTLTKLDAGEPDYRASVDEVLRGLRDRLVVVEGDVDELEEAPAPTNDHGALSGLGDNDHPQYTLATTFSDHDARHVPGGADALPTAAPVAIGATLAEGSAASFARSDHVHTVSLGSVSRTIREINLSGLATNAFTNGTESVDGTNGTVAGSANAGTNWGIVNGQGLRCDAPTSTASVWSHASPNGPSIEFVLSDLIPTYDPGVGPLLIEAYVSSSTTENTGDRLIIGLRRAAGTPITGSSQVGRYALRQGEGAGVTQLASFDGTTITSVTNANIAPQNTLVIRCRDSESAVMTGTYSGGWGTRSMVYRNNSDVGNNGSLLYPQTRLVIAFAWASDASPTSTFTIERLRLSYAI